MWSFDRTVHDKVGRSWHFRLWHDFLEGKEVQHIFFWNEERSETGVLELEGDQTLHMRKVRQRMTRLAVDPEYRKQFRKPLSFPLERHHP